MNDAKDKSRIVEEKDAPQHNHHVIEWQIHNPNANIPEIDEEEIHRLFGNHSFR